MTIKHLILIAACTLSAWACAPSPEPSSDIPPQAAPEPSTKFSEPMQDHLTLEYRACKVDTDCVLALNGCCDCANGGDDIAIARDKVSAFKARFSCTGGCTERGGNCGQGTITCENNLCMYKAPAP